jgi:hypothetical protein
MMESCAVCGLTKAAELVGGGDARLLRQACLRKSPQGRVQGRLTLCGHPKAWPWQPEHSGTLARNGTAFPARDWS